LAVTRVRLKAFLMAFLLEADLAVDSGSMMVFLSVAWSDDGLVSRKAAYLVELMVSLVVELLACRWAFC